MTVEANFSDLNVLENDTVLYKVVSSNRESIYGPGLRSSQYTGKRKTGRVFEKGEFSVYRKNRTHYSDMTKTPGFYCFKHLKDANEFADFLGRGCHVLMVVATAGSYVVFGTFIISCLQKQYETVNAELIEVIE